MTALGNVADTVTSPSSKCWPANAADRAHQRGSTIAQAVPLVGNCVHAKRMFHPKPTEQRRCTDRFQESVEQIHPRHEQGTGERCRIPRGKASCFVIVW